MDLAELNWIMMKMNICVSTRKDHHIMIKSSSLAAVAVVAGIVGGSNSEEAIDLGDYCLTLGPGSAQWSIVIVFSTIVIIVVKLLLLHRLKISPYPNTEWAPMWTQTQCVPTLANVAILLCIVIHRIIKHRLMLIEAGHCCRQLWKRQNRSWTLDKQFSVAFLCVRPC